MRKAIYVLAILVGIGAMFIGPMLGLAVGFLARSNRGLGTGLSEAAISLSLALVGLICGASLAWTGVQALRGVPDRPLRLPGWAWWLVAGVIILVLGQLATGSRLATTLLLPFLHVAASAVGALLFLSLAVGAARSQGADVGMRPGVGSLDWGALGGVAVGMFLELMLVLAIVIAVGLWLSLARPDLAQQVQAWAMEMVQNPGQPLDLRSLRPLLTSPLLVLGGLALLGLAVPLIEESAKSFTVPLIMLTRHRSGPAPDPASTSEAAARPSRTAYAPAAAHMTRLEGFLYGVAAGAGFALVEGMLNGSLALATPRSWGATMAVRGGTAALHCLATGLAGLGWQAGLAERRWGRAAVFWLAALGVHGTWNVVAGVSGLAGLANQPAGAVSLLTTTAQMLAAGAMGLMWILVVVALPLIARQLAAQQVAQSRSQPLLPPSQGTQLATAGGYAQPMGGQQPELAQQNAPPDDAAPTIGAPE